MRLAASYRRFPSLAPADAREVLRLAMARGLLDSGTLRRCGFPGACPKQTLAALVAEGRLSRALVRRLLRLLDEVTACGELSAHTPHPDSLRDDETEGESSPADAGGDSSVAHPRELTWGPRAEELGGSAPVEETYAGFEEAPALPRPTPRSTPLPRVWSQLGGYRLLEELGAGGMGVVYRAHQDALNRDVALKVLRQGRLASSEAKRRFLLEAEAAASLSHPGIVRVHEVGELDGLPFFSMELVEGSPLTEHVRAAGLGPRAIAGLVRQLADAVQHFHQRGIIHRDLKPDNVIVGPGGPRILDFGIAKRIEEDEECSATQEGELLGTLRYMAPEQATGRIREVDTRTDVYALGVILYELLCGRAPFSGLRHGELLRAVQHREPSPLARERPELDADLVCIVEKAMAKEQARRYASAEQLGRDLSRYLSDLPVLAQPPSLAYRLRKLARRRRGVLLVASLLGALTLTQLGLLVRRERSVEGLLIQAGAPGLELPARVQLLQEAQRVDPEHAEVRRALARAREQRLAEERHRRAKLREQQLRAEALLARERAERGREQAEAEARRVQAAVEATEQARARAAAAARERARALAERAAGLPDLGALRLLTQALLLLPSEAEPLWEELAARKLRRARALAEAALSEGQVGLADHWLQEAGALGLPGLDEALAPLRRRLGRLRRGGVDLARARERAERGDWLGARSSFEEALRRGVSPEELRDELSLARLRCRQQAERALELAQQRLEAGDPLGALTRTRAAARLHADLPELASLRSHAERSLVRWVQRRASSLGSRGRVGEALAHYDDALERVSEPRLLALLRAERRARARLRRDPDLAGLVLVPAHEELGTAPVLIQVSEVSNADFARFVAEGGYARDAWWEPAALALREGFRDACPGACRHRGPRGWQEGSHGAQGGRLPVRGVSVHEARAYARWLSARTQARWRLPREREWEVAAGWDPASDELLPYPGGAEPPPPNPRLRRVDELPASPLGVRGCAGNVREWVEGARGPATKGADRSDRGPSWRHYAQVRSRATPGPRPSRELLLRVGFRLVRELDPPR